MTTTEKPSRLITFTADNVRGEAAFAFRIAVEAHGLDEGEFLSQLMEKAVVELHGNAGVGALAMFEGMYNEQHQKNEVG